MREGDEQRPFQPDQQQTPEAYLRGVVEHGAQQLLAELEQGKSEHLQRYLAFSSRFHRFSP